MSKTPKKTMGAKNPRVNITLNEEQKLAHELFHKYDVNFIIGSFGSGKTLAACAMAILAYRKKLFETIWITRPFTKDPHGSIPGTLEEKLGPWVEPIIHNLNQCQSPIQTEKMMKEGTIKIKPVAYAKGITFVNSVVLIDEFEDLTYPDFKLMLSRLGKNSKMVFIGDVGQVDKSVKNPCFPKIEHLKDSDLVGWTELTSNHRNDILTHLFKLLP